MRIPYTGNRARQPGVTRTRSARPGSFALLVVTCILSAVVACAGFVLLNADQATASSPAADSPASALLTPAEQSWLKQHPVIRLAPDPHFKPIEFFDRQGVYQGLAADNIRLLEAKLGVKFSIVRNRTWDEVLDKFRSHQVDLLGAVVATPVRLEFMRISQPLFHVPGAIIVRNTVDHSLTLNKLRGKGMRVAVVSNYTAHDIIKSQYPDIQLDVVPDTAAGLSKVSFGLVDAYVENLATATYYMQEMGISNIHAAGTTPFSYNWGIGVRKDWPELEAIINKGIAAITIEERRAVLDRWIPVKKRWRPGKGLTISAVVLSASLLFASILVWNRTLQRRVDIRTAELNAEIAERKNAEREVRVLNAGLEERVSERTTDLEREIEERQKTQEELQRSRMHLQIVADYASNWEFWRLPDDTFLYMSPSVMALTGYGVQEFVSDQQLIYRVIHHDDLELFRNHIHEVGSAGQILPIEMRIVRKDGEVRWIGHTCQPVYTHDGQPWGWRASNQDITDRKQMEQELFEKTEQLEEEVAEREASQKELEYLNHSLEERIEQAVSDLRRKDQALIQQSRLAAMGEMLNNIAHQWRQPLNIVGLIIQNLQLSYDSGTLTGKEMEAEVHKAMDVIMHMSYTIDDFRNFFREDKQRGGFFLKKVLDRTLAFVSAALESRNITVQVDADDDVTAIGYQNEYAQVVLNIISNACEASLERRVTDPCIHIRAARENNRSVMTIRDNCGGIPEDILPKIFDPYFTTREPDKGSGIGLYMSKVIIEQNMGGRLTVRNIDDGAEFRIEV